MSVRLRMFVPSRSLPHGGPQGALASLPERRTLPVVPLGPTQHLMQCSVEAGQTFADVPHAGSPDLTRFPMSGVERQLAHEIIAGGDRYVELLEVTRSTNRALGVLFIARGEAGAA